MNATKIKSRPVFDSYSWQHLGVLTYGAANDFPQVVDEVVRVSKTGTACLSIKDDFVIGMGFKVPETGDIVVNEDGLTLKKLRRLIVRDKNRFGGCALHFNYNQLYKIRSIYFIPFEQCRLGLPDKDRQIKKIATHPDWARRDKSAASRIGTFQKDLVWYDAYDPTPESIERQVAAAGSWENYKGQILYFSGSDEPGLNYAIPDYIAELTDMRTEEGLSNVSSRNVCSNFMLAGMLVDVLSTEQTDEQLRAKQEWLNGFMGDELALQLLYAQVKSKEEIPQFVNFSGENYDKAFTVTQSWIPDSIGSIFKQPPILRAKDVGANFGADLMSNAYKYYNSVTVTDRAQVQELLEEIFSHWWVDLREYDFEAEVLVYNAGASVAERLGATVMAQITAVLTDANTPIVQKRNTLKYGFGLTDKEIRAMIPAEVEMADSTKTPLVGVLGVGGLQAMMLMLQDPNTDTESKVATLKIVLGLSESDARELTGADINTDITPVTDDTVPA